MTRVIKKINSAGSYNLITHTSQDYYSQTPGDYDIDNYYLRELQDKVDAEWEYRPNRIMVEYETEKAANTWLPIEVVSQGVKSDKGKPVSEDYLNLAFRDIQESRFTVGHKFRFSRNYNLKDKTKDKDTWLVINHNVTSMTSSVVVQRCNGTLGSQWIDDQGVAHNHYEPAILTGELNSVNLFYNSVADSPQAHLVVVAQYNDYTARYQMNQRFILGAHYIDATGKRVAQVYRIKTIDRFYGLTTNDPDNVGLMRIYMEITESSEYDNFETRIAYQEDSTVQLIHNEDQPIEPDEENEYVIVFDRPTFIPAELGSHFINFVPVVRDLHGVISREYADYFITTCELENLPSQAKNRSTSLFDKYIQFKINMPNNGSKEYSFDLRRKQIYLNGDLVVTCALPAEHSPTGQELTTTFKLVVSKQEA